MSRRPAGRALAAALVFSTAATASGRDAQKPDPVPDQQPIRTEATFVRVDVYPTRDGRPVEGLTAGDFEIREDGVLQTIQSFEHVRVPTGPGTELSDPGSQRDMLQAAANPRARLVVVFLDVPHVTLFGSHAVKEPLIELTGRVLGPDDLVGLMTPEMAKATCARASRRVSGLTSLRWPLRLSLCRFTRASRLHRPAAGARVISCALRVEIRPGFSDSQLSGGVMPEPTPRGTTTAIQRRLITCR